MKKKFFAVSTFVFVFVLSFNNLVFAQEEVTITGTVIAVAWDDDENPTQLALSTEEEDFVIATNDLSEELFDIIDSVIEATGTIVLDEDNQKVITISSYTDLGPAVDEDDIENDDDSE